MPQNNEPPQSEESDKAQERWDYAVGYRRPPQATRFQKGQSGNPRGRPPASKNLKTDLQEELLEPIRVTEGGRTVVISKQRAMIKRTIELALKGNMQATQLVTKLIVGYLVMDEQCEPYAPLSADDRAILARFLEKRLPPAEAPQTKNGDVL